MTIKLDQSITQQFTETIRREWLKPMGWEDGQALLYQVPTLGATMGCWLPHTHERPCRGLQFAKIKY
jgi:hypothetical protein